MEVYRGKMVWNLWRIGSRGRIDKILFDVSKETEKQKKQWLQ